MKNIFTRLGLILFGTLLSLVLIEGLLRVINFTDIFLYEYNTGFNQEFHHNYQPNITFSRRPGVYNELEPVRIEVNSLGIRGPEITEDADILLLGDSFVQADEIPFNNTMGELFEEIIAENGEPLNVIAHGQSSWSPLPEWNWYLKVGQDLNPDVVFLFVMSNDFVSEDQYRLSDDGYSREIVYDNEGRPLYFDIEETEPTGAASNQLRIIQLARLILFQLQNNPSSQQAQIDTTNLDPVIPPAELLEEYGATHLLDSIEVEAILQAPQAEFKAILDSMTLYPLAHGYWELERPRNLWTDEIEDRLSISAEILSNFAEDVRENGSDLIIVYVPHAQNIGGLECSYNRHYYGMQNNAVFPDQASGISEWLQDISNQLNITYLDPTSYLQEQGLEERQYFRRDCHWNLAGHESMATFLSDWYRDVYLQ